MTSNARLSPTPEFVRIVVVTNQFEKQPLFRLASVGLGFLAQVALPGDETKAQ
jgi:hypothetical protein